MNKRRRKKRDYGLARDQRRWRRLNRARLYEVLVWARNYDWGKVRSEKDRTDG